MEDDSWSLVWWDFNYQYMYMYICIYVYMYICIYVYMYICIYVYMYICIYVYVCIYISYYTILYHVMLCKICKLCYIILYYMQYIHICIKIIWNPKNGGPQHSLGAAGSQWAETWRGRGVLRFRGGQLFKAKKHVFLIIITNYNQGY